MPLRPIREGGLSRSREGAVVKAQAVPTQLQGRVKDIDLPEVFRLLKMSRKTGALKVVSGRSWGDVYFQEGEIVDAASSKPGGSLPERLLREGLLTPSELSALPADLRLGDQPLLLRSYLIEAPFLTDSLLEPVVHRQIEDVVFMLFGWASAEFQFIPPADITLDTACSALDPEAVIMEASRRLDEWRMILDALGSLEKVPHLAASLPGDAVTLRRAQWDVLAYVDGRRDINTIVKDSGLGRFQAAKTLRGLVKAGLVAIRDPALDLLGQKTAVALQGRIDLYNLAFLTSACTTEVSSHLRLETLEGEEVEVHLSAGVREEAGESCLVYAAEARTPAALIRRLALETSGYVLLVNINSCDSLVVSRRDVDLLKEIGDRPYVVAAYASMVDEKVSEEQVRELLDLPAKVPVLTCNLRDRDEAAQVLAALGTLLP